MEHPSVRSAGPADEAGVINVITLAFCADPLTRWAMPEAAVYLATMPDSVRAFGGNGFAHGTVHCLDGCPGAAMWLPPGVEPDYERLSGLIEKNVAPSIVPDLSAVFEQMAQYHPDEPHWYLPLIGVDPACQGMGLGSALMEHALKRCDAEGMPAYLESSNPRNFPYTRDTALRSSARSRSVPRHRSCRCYVRRGAHDADRCRPLFRVALRPALRRLGGALLLMLV